MSSDSGTLHLLVGKLDGVLVLKGIVHPNILSIWDIPGQNNVSPPFDVFFKTVMDMVIHKPHMHRVSFRFSC